MTQIFLVAGEKSGDIHGANFMRAIKQLCTSINFAGVGGAAMRAQGLSCFLHAEELEVMGFSDILSSLPKFILHFFAIRRRILEQNPPAVVLIDYPGFNLRLARSLKKKGFKGKIIQMICPSVWAWGKKRIDLMAHNLDMLLTIYPFEKELFSHTSLDVRYIGHPIQDIVSNHNFENKWLEIAGISTVAAQNLVAIFPGSRLGEIKRNLPLQLEAAAALKRQAPHLYFAVSNGHNCLGVELKKILEKTNLQLKRDLFVIPSTYSYELMQQSCAAIAKSGTVTLELALQECPAVVTYQLSNLNYFIAKYVLKINLPYYCIVNIVSNKKVFPEYISQQVSAEKIADDLWQLINNRVIRQRCRNECAKLKNLLIANSDISAADAAAQAVLSFLK